MGVRAGVGDFLFTFVCVGELRTSCNCQLTNNNCQLITFSKRYLHASIDCLSCIFSRFLSGSRLDRHVSVRGSTGHVSDMENLSEHYHHDEQKEFKCSTTTSNR